MWAVGVALVPIRPPLRIRNGSVLFFVGSAELAAVHGPEYDLKLL